MGQSVTYALPCSCTQITPADPQTAPPDRSLRSPDCHARSHLQIAPTDSDHISLDHGPAGSDHQITPADHTFRVVLQADPQIACQLAAASGLSLLQGRRYKAAARKFLEVTSDLGNTWNDVMAQQVGTSSCCVVCMDGDGVCACVGVCVWVYTCKLWVLCVLCVCARAQVPGGRQCPTQHVEQRCAGPLAQQEGLERS